MFGSVYEKSIALNFSKCGMYFETNNLLESGSPVYISSENSLIDPLDAEIAKGVHAQVVWCNSITNGSKPNYAVGLKFFERLRDYRSLSMGRRIIMLDRFGSGQHPECTPSQSMHLVLSGIDLYGCDKSDSFGNPGS